MRLSGDAGTAFDRLARIAAQTLGARTALVTVIDNDRQRYRAVHGGSFAECSTADSFCAQLADRGPGAVLIVPDAASDPFFGLKPAVIDGFVGFYAGAAITRTDGGFDGAVCVIDSHPRPPPSDDQLSVLRELAALAAAHIEADGVRQLNRRRIAELELAEVIAGLAHWRYEIATGAIEWSTELYRLHGLTPGGPTPTYEQILQAYHPDDRPMLEASVARAIEIGEGYAHTLRMQRPSGDWATVTFEALVERDAEGHTIALFGVLRDVTEEQALLARVTSSEARYRLMAEHATDVIGEIDLEGVNRFISPSSLQVTGWAPEELVGRTSLELIHPNDAHRVRETYGAMARERCVRLDDTVEYRARRPNGDYVWLEAQPTLVLHPDGRPSHFVDVVRDISRRKAILTALEQARRDAEAANEAKGEFLANMSHELRTPITSIMGFTGLLQQFGQLNDQDRRFVSRIAAGAEALLAVINDVLDYSKLEAGKLELLPAPVALKPHLEDTLALIGPPAAAKRLKLTLDVRDLTVDTPTIDRTRLRQVLLNLLNNAVKFTAQGEITLRAEDADDGKLRFSVTDTGIGIPADRRDRLFQRFSQVDGSTVRDYGGTGLGLAICKALVEGMGGQIGCDSVEGEGSTFWFTVADAAPTLTAAAA